jgi:hypothetical protein
MLVLAAWHAKTRALETLQSMQQRWPVCLPQDVCANLDDQIGSHAEQLAVEGSVMQRAQRESIGN